MSRLRKLEQEQKVIKKIASATMLEGDKTMKEYGRDIAKQAAEEVFKKMDTNKDGKVSLKEGIVWGGEMLNGQGFKMLLITLFSVTFNYIYDYLLSIYNVESGGVLYMVGNLIAVCILTYGYKTVISKMDTAKGTLAETIVEKNKEIRELTDVVQADRLAIEMLKYDIERYETRSDSK